MKAVVRIAIPSIGIPNRVVDRVGDGAVDTAGYGIICGGVDADYSLVAVPIENEAIAVTARLGRSTYDFVGGTFSWWPISKKYDYLVISTLASPASDGTYEIASDGVATLTVDVKKSSGIDDADMAGAGDNEELMVKCLHPLVISTGLKPSLTTGVVSFGISSDKSTFGAELCVGPADNSVLLSCSNKLKIRFI